MLRWEEETLCQSFCNYFTTKAVCLWTYLPVVCEVSRPFRKETPSLSSQVSQIGSGKGPEAMGKPLAKPLDEIINSTPASSSASLEFHRLQPLDQPPVRFSKQEKIKWILPTKKKKLGILTLYCYFKHARLM